MEPRADLSKRAGLAGIDRWPPDRLRSRLSLSRFAPLEAVTL